MNEHVADFLNSVTMKLVLAAMIVAAVGKTVFPENGVFVVASLGLGLVALVSGVRDIVRALNGVE